MRDQPPRALRRAADRAFRATHGAPGLRDVNVRLALGFYRSYAYVGPERIRFAANTRRTELVAAMADPLATEPSTSEAPTHTSHPEGVTA